MKRREFITLIGGAAAWPLAARAQQSALPVVGFVNAGSSYAPWSNAFRKGLNESGYVEDQNVMVEYHWLDGHFDRLPSLMADLVRRRVAVIATPAGNYAAQAAKAATTTIPIVFSVGDDPIKLGLVTNLARPGGNATGTNFFVQEVAPKRLGLLHDLVPKAIRLAVMINPANVPTAEATLREIPEAARAIRLQIQVLNASTSHEIERHYGARPRRRTFRCCRRVLWHPERAICDARGAPRGSRGLFYSRVYRRWRVDELRSKRDGCCSSSRRLHRSNSQGRKACRPTSVAVDEI